MQKTKAISSKAIVTDIGIWLAHDEFLGENIFIMIVPVTHKFRESVDLGDQGDQIVENAELYMPIRDERILCLLEEAKGKPEKTLALLYHFARKILEEELALSPVALATDYIQLGILCREAKDYEASLDYLEKAREMGDNLTVLYELANTCKEMQNFKEAVEYLECARKIDQMAGFQEIRKPGQVEELEELRKLQTMNNLDPLKSPKSTRALEERENKSLWKQIEELYQYCKASL